MTEREQRLIDMLKVRRDAMKEYITKYKDDELNRVHYIGWVRGIETSLMAADVIFNEKDKNG